MILTSGTSIVIMFAIESCKHYSLPTLYKGLCLKKPVRIKIHLPISSGSSAASITSPAKDKVRKATIFYFTFDRNIYVKEFSHLSFV
jgi:hypothetical protein